MGKGACGRHTGYLLQQGPGKLGGKQPGPLSRVTTGKSATPNTSKGCTAFSVSADGAVGECHTLLNPSRGTISTGLQMSK